MQHIKNIVLLACLFMAACTGTDPNAPTDTPHSGTVDISVDETYKPVIEEQQKVFDSSFPEAHLRIHYKPEAQCFEDFYNDKARVILVTRELSATEKKAYEAKKIVTKSMALAKDAVAIIVNPTAKDSVFSSLQIKGIVTGEYIRKYTVVVDNPASSTVRYITDSILNGLKLGSNVYAAGSNEAVVDYVAKNPDAIGFIGLSYVSDDTDKETEAFLKKIKVAYIWNDSLQASYMPAQAYIATKAYPLTRNLYFISRETYPGLGSGFVNFLARERGQLIFAHSRLFPLMLNIVIREADINNK